MLHYIQSIWSFAASVFWLKTLLLMLVMIEEAVIAAIVVRLSSPRGMSR